MEWNGCLSKIIFGIYICALGGCITMVDASKLYTLDKVLNSHKNLCINLEIKRYSNSFWNDKITPDKPSALDENLRTYLEQAASINSMCTKGKKYQISITKNTNMQIYNKGIAYIGTGITFGLLPSGEQVRYLFELSAVDGNVVKIIDDSEINVKYYFGLFTAIANDPFKKRADVGIEGLPFLTSEQSMELSVISQMVNKEVVR